MTPQGLIVQSSLRHFLQRSLRAVGVEAIPIWQLSDFAGRHVRAQHLREVFASRRIDCVFDVGAFNGHFGRFLRQDVGFTGKILSFEPQPEAFRALCESGAGDPAWHAFNIALGSAAGKCTMNIMEKPWFSSFLPPSAATPSNMAGRNAIKATVDVEVGVLSTCYPDLLAAHRFKRAFLKMDTQGFDLEVFRGASACLGEFPAMQSEVAVIPIYKLAPPWTEALAEYQRAGFELSGIFEVSHSEDLRVVEFDAVMVRPEH